MGAGKHRTALGTLTAPQRSPLPRALAAQAVALLVVGLPTLVYFPQLLSHGLLLAMLQGGLAALVAHGLRMPSWWLAIHLVFLPLVILARMLDLPAWFWAIGFVFLALVYWRVDRSRVPLFLSSRQAVQTLLGVLPPGNCRVLDLGSGDGGLLRQLAEQRPDAFFEGVEHAPVPWLYSQLRTSGKSNLRIIRSDFWGHPLAGHDVVYAFLSPAAMPRLWEKASLEMTPGALLVSNSFPVPGVVEDRRIAVNASPMTYFYVYRPGGEAV